MTTTAPDLLATIVAAARRGADVRAGLVPLAQLERDLVPRDGARRFVDALRDGPAPRVIAECKRRSPSRGILRQDYRPADHARAYEQAGAAAISVLTEPTFFDGSLDHLREVRAVTDIPILRKDFIVTRYQIVEAAAAGADAVLLIVGALSSGDLIARLADAAEVGLGALVEVHDRDELSRAVDAGAHVIGVNSRNLRTLAVEPRLHDDLAGSIPGSAVAVAESGLRSADDLRRLGSAGYRAFLIGERFMTEDDPGAALKRLREVDA
jgi:indole-3-glycerol phosphate synthase